MNQNSVKTIGINDEPRKDSYLVYVNQADGLKGILNRDFDEWSNFDSVRFINIYGVKNLLLTSENYQKNQSLNF